MLHCIFFSQKNIKNQYYQKITFEIDILVDQILNSVDFIPDLIWNIFGYCNLDTKYLENNILKKYFK